MSDLSVAFNSPVLVTIDGKEISFQKSSPIEIAAECNRIKAARVADARKLAAEFGVTGIEGLKLVRQAMEEEPSINSIWISVCAPQGAIDFLIKSLKKAGHTEEQAKETLSKLDTETLVETALKVSGYKVPEEDASKKAKIEPNAFSK